MCEDETVALRSLDGDVVVQLHGRLADMRAAESVAALVLATALVGLPTPSVTVDLAHGWVMVCRPNHPATPTRNGEVAWDLVHRLMVVSVSEGVVL
jgi:hypothetical protein